MKEPKTRPHLLGLDLLRISFVIAAIMMHAWNIFYGEPTITLSPAESLYPFYDLLLTPVLGFSGVFLFSISFFLFGYFRTRNLFRGGKSWLRIFIVVGAILSTEVNFELAPSDVGFFNWDLFAFILLSFGLISLLGRLSDKAWRRIGWLSAGLLCLSPFWFAFWFYDRLVPAVQNILLPVTTSLGPNGWFVLPWIGLPLIAYAWGRFCAGASEHVHRRLLTVLVVASVVLVGASQFLPIVPMKMTAYYYDFLFRQHPVVFWRNFLPFLTLLYVFSRASVNQWFQRHRFGFLQRLQWNRHFWFAYALQFGMIDLFSDYQPFFTSHPRHFDFLWLYVLVSVELLMHLFFAALKFYAWLFKKSFGRWNQAARQ